MRVTIAVLVALLAAPPALMLVAAQNGGEPEPPGPDLVVDDLRLIPADPVAEIPVRMRATIVNEGDEPAGPFVVRFLADGEPIGADILVARLVPGGRINPGSSPWHVTEGTHTLNVLADANAQVAESDESNNEGAITFGMPAAIGGVPPPHVAAADDHDDEKVTLCHVPPGNPGAAHTIMVGAPALDAHLAHGDSNGACPHEDDDDDADDEDARHGDAQRRGHERAHEARDAHDEHDADDEDDA